MKKYPNLKSFGAFYKPYRAKIILFVFFAVFAGLIALTFPFAASGILLNLTDGKYGEMIRFAVILFGLIAIEAVLKLISDYLFFKVNNALSFDVRKKMIYGSTKLNLSTVYDNGIGFFLERLSEDSREANIHLNIYKSIISLALNLSFIGYITVLNVWLGLMFALGLIALVFLEYFRVSRMIKNKKQTKRARENIKANETEILKGMKEIKGIGAREAIIVKHSEVSQTFKDLKYKRELFEKKIDGGLSIVKGAIDLMVLLFAGLVLLPRGAVELAAVLVVYNYKGNIYGLITGLAKIKDDFINGELAAKRINDIINAPENQTDIFGSDKLDGGITSIEFKNVTFSYSDDRTILNEISFKIDKPGVYGFVGKSGSGKSTIFSLLSGFYKCQSGKILINSQDLTSIREEDIRDGIMPVLQDPYMFNDTILNNIRFARPGSSDDEVMKACRLAHIHDEILLMKDGYNTYIGENGATISGGQKQRLEIARALLKNSKVILFDEATSALDKNNLTYINDLIIELGKTKIILVIAHRLGVMRKCDKVIVFDNGKVIACDRHDELIKTCGYYAELFKRRQSEETKAESN